MDSLRIRPAGSADAPALSRLLDQLGHPASAAEIPERIEKLHARPGTIVLVAESEGQVRAHEFYKARNYEHTGVRLSKVFSRS